MEMLRPLTVGRLLDRAIVVSAENWRALGIIGLIFNLPYFLTYRIYDLNDEWWTYAKIGGRDPLPYAPPVPNGGVMEWLSLLMMSLQFAITIVVLDRLVRGRPISVAEGLRLGVRRWWLVVAFTLLQVLLAFGSIFAIAVVVTVALAIASGGRANVQAAVVAIASAGIAIALVPVLYLFVAEVASITEPIGFPRSFVVASRRLRSWGRLGRTSVVAIVAIAILVAPHFISVGIAVPTLFVDRSGTLATIVEFAGFIVGTTLGCAVLALHNIDLRVRAEGLDLEVAAAALTPAPAP